MSEPVHSHYVDYPSSGLTSSLHSRCTTDSPDTLRLDSRSTTRDSTPGFERGLTSSLHSRRTTDSPDTLRLDSRSTTRDSTPGFERDATRSSQRTLQDFINARIISTPNEVTGFTQEILDLLLFVLEKYAVFEPDDVEFAYSYLGNFMLSKV
jgi:hypothetical protein